MAPREPSPGTRAIRWAPRVSREKIRRLYENDARGTVDEALVDEVAFGFLARCKSLLTATEAYRGRAACPICSRPIPHSHRADEVLRCEACSWEVPWIEYRRSFQGKQLITQNPDGGPFKEYVARTPGARTPREKMLLVDWLIHEVHAWRPDGDDAPFGRTAAVNLIEGSQTKVIAFLDELAAVPDAPPERAGEHARWRRRIWTGPPPAGSRASGARTGPR